MPQHTLFVPFPELHLSGEALITWAATALFSSELTTPQIEASPALQIRPLVRIAVQELTENARARQLLHEWTEWPEEAAARMTICRQAVQDAAAWPLLDRWKVARDA